MKTWVLRFRQVDRARFDEVRSGAKSIETRAATVKYLPIRSGDAITFVCGKERFTKPVRKVHHFKTIAAMVKELPAKRIMPDVASIAEMRRRYASYPGYEAKIRESGLLAFELG